VAGLMNWSCNKSIDLNGLCHPDFQTIGAILRKELQKNKTGGAAVCVYHRGECVVDLWGGYRDEEGNPWSKDTMAPSFSTTKGVCSTLLHIFADRGLIDYDEKVSTYWPEFAQAGKENITVRQVLCHQSGLYHIRQMIDRADRMLDWEHMIEAIEKTAPAHEPGTRSGYHGLTYGFIAGEIIQRVSGKKFADLVQSEIAKPLGLDGLYIGTPRKELHRAAQLISPPPIRKLSMSLLGHYLEFSVSGAGKLLRILGVDADLYSFYEALAPRGMRNFNLGSAESLRVAIPAGNGLFTARSLAKMYAVLAGGGEFNGVRLLSQDTIELASTLQKHPGKNAVVPFDLRWRLGYHGIYTKGGFQDQAFGHFGMGGSGGWADPSQNLSVAMITNGGLKTPTGISAASLAAARARGAYSETEGLELAASETFSPAPS